MIRVSEREGVVWLHLDEPVRLDRGADRLAWELIDACSELGERARPPHAIVLSSDGNAFWMLAPNSTADCDATTGQWGDAVSAVAALEAPTLAVIANDALGPGWELALACDLRVVSSEARLGSPEIHFGRMPTAGGTQRLTRLAGVGPALELLILGQSVSASRAFDLGLVQVVVEPSELPAAVERLLGNLRSAGPVALALAKEAVHRGEDLTLAEGLTLELDLSALLQTTADRADGIAAFKERRPPRFEGR